MSVNSAPSGGLLETSELIVQSMEVTNENPNGGEFYGQGLPLSSSSLVSACPQPLQPPVSVGEHQENSSQILGFNGNECSDSNKRKRFGFDHGTEENIRCTWTRGGAEWCERNPKGWGILPPTRSAQLTTRDNFSYKFGRLEIRAKAAVGDWLMSQLLLEPQAEVYGRAPAESGLLLISKIRGNQNLVSPEGRLEGASLSITQAHIATCHRILFIFKACELKGKKYSDEMHLYSVIWTPESLKIKLDDCEHEVKPPHGSFLKHGYFKDNCENSPWEKGTHLVPFDQEFYVSFKLIPGGFGLHHDVDISPNGKPKSAIYSEGDPKAPLSFWRHKEIWLPTWTSDLEVDSVKVWAL